MHVVQRVLGLSGEMKSWIAFVNLLFLCFCFILDCF